ncbi:MAG: thiamine-phosphate kinase [Pseudomonadota bacterium]
MAQRGRRVADLDEEALIQRIAQRVPAEPTAQCILGIGDDAALLRPRSGHEIVVTTDLAVEEQDFVTARFAPRAVGHRALAQNLSDLAAMGASPLGFVLGLSLRPELELRWLDALLRGLRGLVHSAGCPLLGGDLSATCGPLQISITALGDVPRGRALRRAGARPGDAIWVSGTPGLAGAGLLAVLGSAARCPRGARQAFWWPQPRLQLGMRLRGLATACIDLSDGLLRDLGRLASASGVAAHLDSSTLPRRPGLELAQSLGGGEDFELLFTAPPRKTAAIARLAGRLELQLTEIGKVAPGRRVLVDGKPFEGSAGFDHFAGASRERLTRRRPHV